MLDLHALLSDPTAVLQLSAEDRAGLRVMVATLAAALDACLAVAPPSVEVPAPEDRLLTAVQVAARIGRSRDWVYAHASGWPFTRRLGPKTLRFSEAGLARYLDHPGRTKSR